LFTVKLGFLVYKGLTLYRAGSFMEFAPVPDQGTGTGVMFVSLYFLFLVMYARLN